MTERLSGKELQFYYENGELWSKAEDDFPCDADFEAGQAEEIVKLAGAVKELAHAVLKSYLRTGECIHCFAFVDGLHREDCAVEWARELLGAQQ